MLIVAIIYCICCRCHLKVASCASEGKIRVAKKGECVGPATTPNLLTSAPMVIASKNANNGKSKKQHPLNRRGNGRRQGRRNDKKHNRRQSKKREKNYQRAPKLERQRRS